MKSSLKTLIAVGALALAATQASASTFTVNTGGVYTLTTTNNTIAQPPGSVLDDPAYYEFKVGAGVTGAVFKLKDTDVDALTVTYNLYEDTNNVLGSYSTGAQVATWTFTDPSIASFYAALNTGAQYVLKIATNGAYSSSTEMSAVPLPGAALLFGSALLGLAGLRRKQAAGKEMAAV